MSHSPLTNLQLRLVVTALIGVVTLLIGLLWLGEQTPSWAAPAQNPNLQTVPPRPPDENPTPEPPDSAPLPPGPAPSAEPPSSPPQGDENDGDQANDAPPAQPTEEKDNENQDKTQLPKQKDKENQNQDLPAQPPGDKGNENQDQSSGEKDQAGSALDTSPQADLSLSKTVNNPTPRVGEAITFTVVISNSGPSNASNVTVSELLPPGLSLSSATPSRGNYDARTGLWVLNIITHSESVTLSVVITVMNAGIVTNTAEITTTHLFDPDSSPGNGIESEDDQASAAIAASLETSPIPESEGNSITLPSTSGSASKMAALSDETGSLGWLYALCLGVILILSGVFLVRA